MDDIRSLPNRVTGIILYSSISISWPRPSRSRRESERPPSTASHDESRNERTGGRVRFLPAANQFHAELRSGDGEGGVDDDDDRIVFIAIATAEREGERRVSRNRRRPRSWHR